MIDLLYQIVENILWGPDLAVQPIYAIAPALVALAAGSALAGGAKYLAGRGQRRKLRKRADEIDAERAEAMEESDAQIEETLGFARNIDTDVDESAEDVYGESIQTLMDRVQSGRSGTEANLSKAVMAGGGDITGSIQATLGKLTEQSNKSIVDVMNEYNERVDRRNLQRSERAKSRKAQMFQNVLGARQNQFATLAGAAERAHGRVARKSSADQQFLADSIGTGANIAALGTQGG